MHTVFFSLKRVHWRTFALLHGILSHFAITPARYDLLFVIFRRGLEVLGTRRLYQSNIRRELGVTSVTVCKLLKALERDGFVRRKRCPCDRRQVIVELTRKAFRLLRRVNKRVIRPGCLWLVLYATLGVNGERVGALKSYLDQLRRTLRDQAEFHYPWCNRTLWPRRQSLPDGERHAIA